jgi:hypothetical protein
MNPTRIDNSPISPDPIDQILATEQELIPSSGFLASVMESVHEEARKPAPIHFPWKRALPGILLATGVFGWGAYEFARQAIPAVKTVTFSAPQLSVAVSRPLEQAAWVAMALGVSLASWLLSRRLAGQSGML